MAIYTKTGDKGKTSTFSGKRVLKSSKLINTIGSIDELNSFLGIVKSCSNDSNHCNKIEKIQNNLFTINSILAGSKLTFATSETKKLENEIDKWEGILPVQKNFIFYGGSRESSLLFYARALARRAERSLVSISKIQSVNPDLLIYFNRLSDYLFMMARNINFKKKVKEEYWETKK